MLQLQLYIKEQGESSLFQQVELFKDESIVLTQAIQDVKDIEKIFADFTKTFSVPASRINNKVFKHFYNYNILDFDARKKFEAELFLNHKPFKKGKIKLEGTTTKQNKPSTYRLTFYGSSINLKDVIGDDTLSALKMITSDFTFTYSDANIKTYLSNGLDITSKLVTYTDAILFPLISHTKRLVYNTADSTANTTTQNNIAFENGTQHGLELSQLKPALRIYPIIKAIEFQYGLTFSEDFFNKTNLPFYNLYLWLHNKSGGLFEDEGNITPVGNFKVIDSDRDVIDLRSNYFKTPPNNISSRLSNKERQLDVTIVPNNNAVKYNFIIYENGNIFQRYDDLTGEFKDIRNLVLSRGDYSFGIETGTPSTYAVKFFVKRDKTGSKAISWTGDCAVLSSVNINISNQLPDIGVLKFLTGLFKMFNLTAFQNDEGIIEIKTLDNFYSTSTQRWDITKHLDKESSTVDSVLPFKQIDFTYEGLDNFFAKNHKELFNVDWGENRYQSAAKFEGSTYTIKLPFEHFKYERFVNVANGANVNAQWGRSADIKQEPNLGKPLLFYPILKTQAIGVIDSSGTLSSQSAVYIPSNSLTTTQTSILGIDASDNINFNAEKNEFTNIPYNKTLFQNYYNKYISEIFDKQRRLTTVKAYLPISLLFNLSLADKMVIFDRLYKINKLSTNFETNLSTLELINIKEEAGAEVEIEIVIPPKFTPDVVCRTADSEIITVDNALLNADVTCGSGELPIVSTDEEVPVNTSTGNIPEVKDKPLVVTSATISQPLINQLTNNTATTVNLKGKIDEVGTIGDTPSLDEYGFLYSSTFNDLVGDDVDTIAEKVGVTQYAVTNDPTEGEKVVQLTGLSDPSTVFFVFYTKTNTDPTFATSDTIGTIDSSGTVPSSPYSETTNSKNYKIITTADNPADIIRTIKIKTDDGDFVDYITSGELEIQSKIVPYVVEGVPIPANSITTQYDVTTNGLSNMLETQMSLSTTINGVKQNSGIGFAYSATSRVDAENDSQTFGTSTIPFKDVAVPKGTVNYSDANQNYNVFANEGTSVYTNWNDATVSDYGFINGTATSSTAVKTIVPDGYYAQWGWNTDGTAQDHQNKNCGFSVHVLNGVIIGKQTFGACITVASAKGFNATFTTPKYFDNIPLVGDLKVTRNLPVPNYTCGDVVVMAGIVHSGAEPFPEVGDKTKFSKGLTYDGGVDSFIFHGKPFVGQESAKYMPMALGEAACFKVGGGGFTGICQDYTIVGWIVIEIATATVVQRYNCS